MGWVSHQHWASLSLRCAADAAHGANTCHGCFYLLKVPQPPLVAQGLVDCPTICVAQILRSLHTACVVSHLPRPPNCRLRVTFDYSLLPWLNPPDFNYLSLEVCPLVNANHPYAHQQRIQTLEKYILTMPSWPPGAPTGLTSSRHQTPPSSQRSCKA